MKLWTLLLLIITCSYASANGLLTAADSAQVRQGLQTQSQMLESQSARTCEGAYRRIFGSDSSEVRIAIFYGYEDEKEATTDQVFAELMIEKLQQPCRTSNLQSCGFQSNSVRPGVVELKRDLTIEGRIKSVFVTVASSSLTDNNRLNSDLQTGYWEQMRRSAAIEAEFYAALKNSQVVFYHGHARYGTGPGFKPESVIEEGLGRVRRKPFQNLLTELSGPQSKVQLFAYFACESEKYYSHEMNQAAQNMGLIVTMEPVYLLDSELSVLGALNSVLSRKCQGEFQDSLIPVDHPGRSRAQVQNFFK